MRTTARCTTLPLHQTLARMAAPVLSDIEIQRALGQLPGWSRRANVITKTFVAATFPAGITFVSRIADAAEAVQHHPDIDIRYTKITIALSTHDSGGLTQKDIDLARVIEGLFAG
jgi:4a-hydroxytetrahydrobiopterin dehydratase